MSRATRKNPYATVADVTVSIPDNSVTLAKMADDSVGIAELSASGTADSTTTLFGDNVWRAPAITSAIDGGTPSSTTTGTIDGGTP